MVNLRKVNRVILENRNMLPAKLLGWKPSSYEIYCQAYRELAGVYATILSIKNIGR